MKFILIFLFTLNLFAESHIVDLLDKEVVKKNEAPMHLCDTPIEPFQNPFFSHHPKPLYFNGELPHEVTEVKFPQNKDSFFGTYISLDLPFDPYKSILDQMRAYGHKIKTRGEAHITLLTPVEYQCYFGPSNVAGTKAVNLDRIQAVVARYGNKIFDFDILAMGSGKIDENETYFLIVEGEIFNDFRDELADLISDPILRALFKDLPYYPHITIGFTHRDLHISDGIYKGLEHSKDLRYRLIEAL